MSIQQVAKYAGVSTATVSRVMNSVPLVSASTVQAVRAAMTALNYTPAGSKSRPKQSIQRASVGQQRGDARVGMIAVMTIGRPDITQAVIRSPVINAVVESLTRSAKQNGVQLLIDDVMRVDEVTKMIESRMLDGAVVLLTEDSVDELMKLSPGVPVVWAMGGQAGPLPVDHVSANNIAVGCLAHQYLSEQGCKHFGFFSCSPSRRFSQQRGYSFAGAVREAGARSRTFVLSEDPNLSDLFGRSVSARPTLAELVGAFVEASPRPDGLFIDRDATTALVYPMLLQRGVQPGRDVTIISCDNEDVRLLGLFPRPATIDLGTLEIGDRAVRRLLARIANPDEPQTCVQAMPRLIPGSA